MRRVVPKEEIVIEVAPDGTILEPPRGDFFAACIADGETPDSAWRTAGGVASARELELRAAIEAHPAFPARVEALRREKAAALADPTYGQAIWMINLAFSECKSKRDRAGMMECIKMRLQAAQGVARLAEKLAAAANPPQSGDQETKPPGQVGKPSEKSPQSARNVGEIRLALLEKGLNVGPREADDEAA